MIIGVDIDTTNSNPSTSVVRIGPTGANIAGHQASYTGPASAGTLFNAFGTWGNIKRCNLWDDGTATAYYGDRCYTDTDVANMGQCMVKVPRFLQYVDLSVANHIRVYIGDVADARTTITTGGADHVLSASTDVHPAFKENSALKNYLYVGAYEAYNNGGTLESKAGVFPTGNVTPANFRIYANAINADNRWTMMTGQAFAAFQSLYLVEYKNLSSRAALGNGNSRSSGTPALLHTGLTGSYGTDRGNASYGVTSGAAEVLYQSEMSYRGVENIHGNLYHFLDGITKNADGGANSSTVWIKDFPPYNDALTGYTNTTAVLPAATKAAWQTADPTLLGLGYYMPKVDTETATSTTYWCDYYTTGATGLNRILMTHGTYNSSALISGMFACATHALSADAAAGTRLQYHEV